MKVSIVINDVMVERDVEERLLLVDFIREVAGLTGTHVGCDTTSCGACTVEVAGRTVKSCTQLAVQTSGKHVITIEGLAKKDEYDPIQEAFWEHHGLQCGYCTPGMVMSARQLLKSNPSPTEFEIRQGIAGNICRCTGYQNIVEAIKAAAERIEKPSGEI